MKKKFTLLAFCIISAMLAWAKVDTPQAPPFLKPGDSIAVISPGSTPSATSVEKGCEVLREWAFHPVKGQWVTASHHLWAGTDTQRVADLLWALRNPAIKAILCSRGGYGSSQLLYKIPIDTLRKYNKWIVGYSDITALHSGWVRAGHMSIHGNMCGRLAATEGADTLSQVLRELLMGKVPTYKVKGHRLNQPGTAQGILIGGNMSVFVNISGSATYDFLDRDYVKKHDVILFFEDVGENISRVSSMLFQLKVKGVLDRVKGVIVGHFTEYEPSYGYNDMYEMLHEFLSQYNIPVCYDFPTSHDEDLNYPLIEGCPATLQVTSTESTLKFHLQQK